MDLKTRARDPFLERKGPSRLLWWGRRLAGLAAQAAAAGEALRVRLAGLAAQVAAAGKALEYTRRTQPPSITAHFDRTSVIPPPKHTTVSTTTARGQRGLSGKSNRMSVPSCGLASATATRGLYGRDLS